MLSHKKKSLLKIADGFLSAFISQTAFDSKTGNGYLINIFENVARHFISADPCNILTFLDNQNMSGFNRKDETDLKRYEQNFFC